MPWDVLFLVCKAVQACFRGQLLRLGQPFGAWGGGVLGGWHLGFGLGDVCRKWARRGGHAAHTIHLKTRCVAHTSAVPSRVFVVGPPVFYDR